MYCRAGAPKGISFGHKLPALTEVRVGAALAAAHLLRRRRDGDDRKGRPYAEISDCSEKCKNPQRTRLRIIAKKERKNEKEVT